jgi:hypothetical protein
MRLLAWAVMIGVSLAASAADAAQVWSRTRITGVAAVGEDLEHPTYSNMVWVGVAETAFLPQACRDAGGLLFPAADQALLAVALQALERGRPVVVKAETSRRIGDYCRLVQITLYAD